MKKINDLIPEKNNIEKQRFNIFGNFIQMLSLYNNEDGFVQKTAIKLYKYFIHVTEHQKDLSSQLKDICQSIKALSFANGCYFYATKNNSNKDKILFYWQEDEPQLDNCLEENWEKIRDVQMIANTVGYVDIDIDNHFLVIRFELNENDTVELLLRFKEEIKEKNCLFIAKNILFMRSELVDIFVSNFNAIMNEEYYQINRIHENETKILHISDLHLDIDYREYYEHMCIKFARNVSSKQIDFLVITGDLIQADSEPGKITKKYEFAAYILEKMAKIIFGFEWKHRVIIVPGNHDYATMAEMKVQNVDRRFKNVVPFESNSFVKFIYFQSMINMFFNKYSFNAFKKIYESDSNYIIDRFAKIYGIKFICLNSSYASAYYRQNKVKLNIDIIKKAILNELGPDTFNICLMHHAPTYKINYLEDRNRYLFGKEDGIWETVKQVLLIKSGKNNNFEITNKTELENTEEKKHEKNLEVIIKKCQDSNTKLSEMLNTIKEKTKILSAQLNDIGVTKDKVKENYPDYSEWLEFEIENRHRTQDEVFKEFEEYYKQKSEKKEKDIEYAIKYNGILLSKMEEIKNRNFTEKDNNIIEMLISDIVVSQDDRVMFEDACKSIAPKMNLFLSGHIHRKQEEKYGQQDKKIITAGLFLNTTEKNIAILTIDHEKKVEIEWIKIT